MIKLTGKITGLAETSSAISQIPSLLQQAGIGAMTESLELFSTILRTEHMEGPYPEEIQSRTGRLRASFRRGDADNIFQVRAEGTKIIGITGSKDKRGPILNEGGVIRSSRPGGFLAVRTEFTKTAGGVVRAKYQQPLRQLPNTFVRPIHAPKAKAAVFERIGRRIIPIAWLVKQVTIIGRKFMQKTEAKVAPQLPNIFGRRFTLVLDRLNETLRRVGGR